MNPDATIRKWLLACASQDGVKQAHDYRYSDAESRQEDPYFTYQLLSMEPTQEGHQSKDTTTGYTLNKRDTKNWMTTVQIDLHNSQNGLEDLASYVVALDGNPIIRAIFDGYCAFNEVVSLVNLTVADDDADIRYHQRLICTFTENVEITISTENEVVDSITTGDTIDINHPGS